MNPNNFLTQIPRLHPSSEDYRNFWNIQKERCIIGYWANGYYMPPALYFYANFSTIRLNKKRSQAKVYDRPFLRDVEWILFRSLLTAKGFSGFKEDPNYTCLHKVLDTSLPLSYFQEEYPSTISPSGSLKSYIDPLDYLNLQHSSHYPTPLYENPVKNFMLMGARNWGKSYSIGAGLIPHTFLFDNRLYTDSKLSPTEILVGSVVSDKSADLLKKTKDAIDFLPGAYETSSLKFPSPFSKRYTGSWAVNSEIIAQFKRGKTLAGSRSSIKHRSFNENSFAAQGTRPSILVIEECGLVPNLIDIYNNTVDNLKDGLIKTGSLIMLGTGGDMEKGTIPSSQMFFEPEKYDILKFTNVYEQTQVPMGFFLPAYYSLNEFKDENGNTDIEKATKALMDERDKLKKGSSDALFKAIQYKPLTPSEMFLNKAANIFPAPELRSHLTFLINNPPTSFNAELYFDPTSPYNGVSYKVDEFSTPLDTYPYSSDSREGAITIYELPSLVGNAVPPNSYIIGHDPIKEDTPTGPSLAVIYVMKTTANFSSNSHSEIVAVYRGRPYEGKNAINNILHKLSLFYGNAKIYFEAQVGNVKDYFERISRLDLLCTTPTTIFQRKAAHNSPPPMTYGYPMSNDRVKWEAIQYTRNFLLETHHDNYLNLHLIPDKALVQELLSFNMTGNFDSVMTLVGCVVGLQEIHNTSVKRAFSSESRKMINSEFDKINKRLFPNVNQTAPFF